MDQPEALSTFLDLTGPEAPARRVIRAYDRFLFQPLLTGQPCAFSYAGHWRHKEDLTGRQRNREKGNTTRDREESEQLERLGGAGA